jgi:hypothetical protein
MNYRNHQETLLMWVASNCLALLIDNPALRKIIADLSVHPYLSLPSL